MSRQAQFGSVRLEGSLFTYDQLQRILLNKAEGTTPEGYKLYGEKIGEAVSRAWDKALRLWSAFQQRLSDLPPNDPATTLTRDRWLHPLFGLMGYGPLQTAKGLTAGEETFSITHQFLSSPIHLLGCRVKLDHKTPGLAGAARRSPHGLVQEYLNKSPECLWGIVTNGYTLRLLRDNLSVARMSYVEFDLHAMMENQSYSDFVLLWMLIHFTSLETRDGKPETCRLEAWARDARDSGVRALEDLRGGVEAALRALGKGFLTEPANEGLRQKLQKGDMDAQEYLQQLMRLVYRLIFLFVAEDRDLLLLPPSPQTEAARKLCREHYSTARLRGKARTPRDARHKDLWEGLKTFMGLMHGGYAPLALPAFGSFLWSKEAMPRLMDASLGNLDLLTAIRSLCWTDTGNHSRQAVDWKNLGSEELGSIYESLLEYIPSVRIGSDEPFELVAQAGNERKTTGSYYTPASLISSLLDTALEPVIQRAVQGKTPQDAAKALLSLKVCDPSCGSGHFLVGAAHRMAKRLASIQTGDDEPAPEALRAALRQVVSHCLYGVDLNPMSVELCKVALWMEAMEQGKPLSFLDHHIRSGNSLIGATPAGIANGIPNEAFKEVTGDDPGFCATLRKRNKEYRPKEAGQQMHFLAEYDMGIDKNEWRKMGDFQASLDRRGEDTLEDVRTMEKDYDSLRQTDAWQNARLVADAWCAAFTQKKARENSQIIDEARFSSLKAKPWEAKPELRREVASQFLRHRFFHWHLEFLDVFHPGNGKGNPNGWEGGFDVVLGNPPWDKVRMEEVPWFSSRVPMIAKESTAAKRKLAIRRLKTESPRLYAEFEVDKRKLEAESLFIHNAGCYPLGAVGDVNTYVVFAELNRGLISATGRAGFIVPSGIATDKGTSIFFGDLASKNQITSLYSFINRFKLFPGVDSRQGFSLMTMTGTASPAQKADYAFYIEQTEDLADRDRHFDMSGAELRLFNPNTGNCPTFRNGRDKQIAGNIYGTCPVLVREMQKGQPEQNPWNVQYKSLFHMSNDSDKFYDAQELAAQGFTLVSNHWRKGKQWMVPLYEGKMVYMFDNRYATYEKATESQLNSGQLPKLTDADHSDPWHLPMPTFWVSSEDTASRLDTAQSGVICFRKITNATNERTMIASFVAWSAFGDGNPLLLVGEDLPGYLLSSVMSTYAFDFITRLSVGNTNLNFYILNQLPILTMPMLRSKPSLYGLLEACAIELSYTCWDLYPYVCDKLGRNIPPYRWQTDRRHTLEVLLNAIIAHYYGVDENDLAYIMDQFPGVCRDEEAEYGSFRLKEEIISALALVRSIAASTSSKGHPLEGNATAQLTNEVSQRIKPLLDPPPAHPSQQHLFPSRQEAESKMPWIDWSSLP